MANHPNRGSRNRKLAEAHGYFVREGTHPTGPNNCLGCWYVGRDGEPLNLNGRGFPSIAQAWTAAVNEVRAAHPEPPEQPQDNS